MKFDIKFCFWAILVITFTISLLGFGTEIPLQYRLINVLLACIGWEISSQNTGKQKGGEQ